MDMTVGVSLDIYDGGCRLERYASLICTGLVHVTRINKDGNQVRQWRAKPDLDAIASWYPVHD